MKIDETSDIQISEVGYYSNGYVTVKNENKYGVLDLYGNIVIPFEYDSIGDYQEELFCVEKEGKCGYIDLNNKWVIKPIYRRGYDFSEGLACVANDDLQYGYIDKEDKVIIPLNLGFAECFSEGLALVETKDFKTVFIDKKGEVVFETEYEDLDPFNNGLSLVRGENELYGAIDKTGKLVLEFSYDTIYSTRNYVMGVLPDGGSRVIMDKKGNVLDLTPEIERELNEIQVKWNLITEGELCGLEDCNANLILPCEYDQIRGFKEDSSLLIVIKDDKYGLVKIKTNVQIIPINNLYIESLHQNRFLVRKTKTEALVVDSNNNEIFKLDLSDNFETSDEIIDRKIEEMKEKFEEFEQAQQERKEIQDNWTKKNDYKSRDSFNNPDLEYIFNGESTKSKQMQLFWVVFIAAIFLGILMIFLL